MHSIALLSIAAFAGFSAAQSAPQANYPYSIDPDTVDQSTRGTSNATPSFSPSVH